ncbi:uncharacterized protein LOC112053381 [Bicyclus anynana]|uniref:Uncharacterized protein LOC112053381 n=1 Tax=Bicyclus anynana TaxID=110368 RepID=A0ABM3LMK7_BICAN|nr:uncharacterized protein LOC112053381 [Bicyclus anynana]
MSDMNECTSKIWSRFEAKKQDGSVIKLRIQSWQLQSKDDVYEFILKHFVSGEAIHKAAGITRNPEALKEYGELLDLHFKVAPLCAEVCCVDNDGTTVDQILGVSMTQLMTNTQKLEDITKELDLKTAEIQQLLHAAKVLEGYLQPHISSYNTFYFGRGLIVHPEYRKLGIANEFIKVRKLVCIANNVPMTCAGMSAVGSQKAAEKNNWKTFVDIPIDELEKNTGLVFEKDSILNHNIMYTTTE